MDYGSGGTNPKLLYHIHPVSPERYRGVYAGYMEDDIASRVDIEDEFGESDAKYTGKGHLFRLMVEAIEPLDAKMDKFLLRVLGIILPKTRLAEFVERIGIATPGAGTMARRMSLRRGQVTSLRVGLVGRGLGRRMGSPIRPEFF
jgi:hypothetical protein